MSNSNTEVKTMRYKPKISKIRQKNCFDGTEMTSSIPMNLMLFHAKSIVEQNLCTLQKPFKKEISACVR